MAYILDWDLLRLGDMNYDIQILDDRNSITDLKRKIQKSERIETIEEIEFLANMNSINQGLDFPVSFGYPVMSDKMISTLQEEGANNLNLIPVVLIDDAYLAERYNNEGELKNEVIVNRSYKLIQTCDIITCLDMEKSSYSPMMPGQKFPTVIQKMVLRKPVSGFPPLFRMEEKKSLLFVSNEVKERFEQEKITGVRLIPVEEA